MFDFRQLLSTDYTTQIPSKTVIASLNYVKVFVCGGSGLLGADLCEYLQKNDIEHQGTYHTNFKEGLIQVNFNNILFLAN